MTLKSDGQWENRILGKANYILSLLKQPFLLQNVRDVSPEFLIRIFGHLFGQEIFFESNEPRNRQDCLKLIIGKLSDFIGLSLDHIDPTELAEGNNRTTFHLLELYATFIQYCLEENLFKLKESLLESTCSGVERHPTSSGFSNSPELPRSVGRPCMPTNYLQISSANSKSFLDPDKRNDDLQRSHAKLPHTPVSTRGHHSLRKTSSHWAKHVNSPSDYGMQFRQPRHWTLQATATADSPPATPKTADEFMEIVGQQSPPSKVSSLRLSPLPHDPTPLNRSTKLTESPARQPPPSSNNASSPVQFMTTPPSARPSSNVVSKLDVSNYSRHRKISSSSSGCGPSPTHTLTAVDTSASSSIDEYLQPADEFKQSLPLDFQQGNPPTSPRVDGSKAEHGKSFGADVQYDGPMDNVKSALDDLTSLISSSLSSECGARFDVENCPSASSLIVQSEGFVTALKQRLDYLRSVFSRAQEEAEAVGRLVQAIDSRRLTTVQLMQHCVSPSNDDMRSIARTLQEVRAGVDLLLAHQRQPTSHRRHTRHSFPLTETCGRQHHTCRHHGPSTRSTYASDTEYKELMALKHRLMIDALQACYLALDSHKIPPPRRARKSCLV